MLDRSPIQFSFLRIILNICLGLISRAQAEDLLQDQEIGSFLIRLSDKIWGYTISYKCEERIKHFLIDAMNFKKVKFDGNSEKMHKDLHALITFHEVRFSIIQSCIQNRPSRLDAHHKTTSIKQNISDKSNKPRRGSFAISCWTK